MHRTLSRSPNISIEESQRLIDEAIAQHQASIVTLKSQRNSLAPISSLPLEILCQIFGFLKLSYGQLDPGSDSDSELEDSNPPSSLSWIAVTHVSSHWRRVAVNAPSLWVDLPLENIRWVEEMLKRCKDAGLVIGADFTSLANSRTVASGFKLALKHGSRIKHLSVHNMYDLSARNALQMELPRLATPCLEYFSITYDSDNLWDRRNDESTQQVKPIAILEGVWGATERLRHLELHKCHFNWNSQPFLPRSLTHLSLHDLTLNSKPTGQQFIDALKGMPDLQYLDLTNALPFEDTSWASDHIYFASLQTLIVHSVYREVEPFLRCVTFPPAAVVKVECIVDRDPASDLVFSGVVLGLARSYSNALPGPPFRRLIFHPDTSSGFGICLKLTRYSSEEIVKRPNKGPRLELSFLFQANPPEQQITKLITSNIFSGAIPLQDITEIYLLVEYTNENLSSQMIADTFGKLPHVRTVVLNRYSSPLFFNALMLGSYFEKEGWAGQVEKLYFPSLTVTSFSGALFGEPEEQLTLAVSVKLLRECIVRRASLGTPMESLNIIACANFKKSDARSLSEVVGKIHWDQREISPSGWGYGYGDSKCI